MSAPTLDLRQPDTHEPTSGRSSPLSVSSGSPPVLSAHVSTNDAVFEQLMRLHVDDDATVADVTWGKGTFWKLVPEGRYKVLPSDLQTGVDCRALPYTDESVDCVVLDPPYVAGFFRPHKVGGRYQDFTHRYSGIFREDGPRYHEGVIDLYTSAAKEAHRVLKKDGRLVLKCQDEVHAGKQYLTHVELVNRLAAQFDVKDLFVVMRNGGNFRARGRSKHADQHHARKNHSYFLVFVRRDAPEDKANSDYLEQNSR